MTLKLAKLAGASTFALALVTLPSAGAEEPLAIAKQGYFFVGGKYVSIGDKQMLSGQAYVEYQIPARLTQPFPLVIVPGAAQTATNFTGTADGRDGWAQFFLRRGYAVYIVEQPGRGRSSYQPDTDGPQAFPQLLSVQQRFTASEKYSLWPQARLHTQPEPARRAMRRSTNSSLRRCRSCRSRRSPRRSTATPLCH